MPNQKARWKYLLALGSVQKPKSPKDWGGMYILKTSEPAPAVFVLDDSKRKAPAAFRGASFILAINQRGRIKPAQNRRRGAPGRLIPPRSESVLVRRQEGLLAVLRPAFQRGSKSAQESPSALQTALLNFGIRKNPVKIRLSRSLFESLCC